MIVEALIFFVVLLLTAAVAWDLIGRYLEPPNLPPGPRIFPLSLLFWSPQDLIQLRRTDLARKYDGVYTFKIGTNYRIQVTSIAFAKEVLLSPKGHEFAGRLNLNLFSLLSGGGKTISFGDYSPTWKLQRKIAHAALRMFGSGMSRIQDKVFEELEHLSLQLEKEEGRVTDLDEIRLAVLNVICAMVFGSRYELDDPEFKQILHKVPLFLQLFGYGPVFQILPWLQHLPIKVMRDVREVISFRQKLCKRKLEEHKEKLGEEDIRDLTDALLRAMMDAEKEGLEVKECLTEEHVMMTMWDTFVGGFDTTTATIRWIIAYMITFPDLQVKLHNELDEVIGQDRMPTLHDRGRLPYLEATIREILRHGMPLPLSPPHKTTVDTTLGRYNVPKGTMVALNLWAIHHDPKEWKNAYEFDPCRFLDDEGKLSSSASRSFLPFGAGPRSCLGESLAKAELFLFTSWLFHRFRFEIPPECPPPDLQDPVFSVVSQPKPFSVCIRKRH